MTVSKTWLWIAIALFLVVLTGAFFGGYFTYKSTHPCPQITHDTVYVHDTVTHHIIDTIPYYIVKKDTVILTDTVFKDIDTTAVLRDYYAMHYYDRVWEDSLLKVELEDVITRNQSIKNVFTYKILRPQTVIQNIDSSVHNNYTRYLYGGITVPIKELKYTSIDLTYAFRKGYVGAGYSPGVNGFNVKAGLTIFKLK